MIRFTKNAPFGFPRSKVTPAEVRKAIHVPSCNSIVLPCQCAASTSMYETLKPAYDDNKNKCVDSFMVKRLRDKGAVVVIWIRNPLERFAAAWNIFGKKFCNVDSFAEFAMANFNAHWSPISGTMHEYKDEFLPSHVYAFEDLPETWEDFFPGWALEHRNNSMTRRGNGVDNRGRLYWDDLREHISREYQVRLMKYYEEDIVLHAWALEQDGLENIA